MPTTDTAVSGDVQADADVSCYNDEHEPARMVPTDETTEEGNSILECPECGTKRAVNLVVNTLKPVEAGDGDE